MMEGVRVVAIIQARMGSTRLPGKVLEEIGGETMLARVVARARQSSLIHDIIVATTNSLVDDSIVNECKKLNVSVYRGEEDDVLDRYYQTALAYQIDNILRITSDCPLIDPTIIDRVVTAFLSENPDYASNVIDRTYPLGLDVEVMTMSALTRAWHEAVEKYQRIHVTPFIFRNPDLFHLLSVKGDANYSHHRWTVDTPEDLDLLRRIYERLGNDDSVSWEEVIKLLDYEPDLVEINRHIQQKALKEG